MTIKELKNELDKYDDNEIVGVCDEIGDSRLLNSLDVSDGYYDSQLNFVNSQIVVLTY